MLPTCTISMGNLLCSFVSFGSAFSHFTYARVVSGGWEIVKANNGCCAHTLHKLPHTLRCLFKQNSHAREAQKSSALTVASPQHARTHTHNATMQKEKDSGLKGMQLLVSVPKKLH